MSVTSLRIYLVTALLAAAGWTSAAQAQSLRCRNDIANVGDSKDEVRRKCGEPAARDRGCEVLAPLGSEVRECVDVETWTYRPGYGQFITKLSFQGDEMVKISYGDRQ